MAEKRDLNKLFDELTARYIGVIERNYKWRYSRAKDKAFVKGELKTGVNFIVDFFPSGKEKLINHFWEWYKRGEDFGDIINHLRKTYGEIDDVLPFRQIVDGKAITLYLNDEEKALKKLALDERKLMKLLINYTAHKDIQKRFDSLFEENDSEKAEKNHTAYPVKWTGKKDNKNEFVQLVYGLHKAGYLNEGKGEITKITEELARIFNVPLAKSWQSNLSTSIHNASGKYEPAIFSKIPEAYKNYAALLRKEKLKNKE